MSSKFVLYYFNGRAAGEAARLLLIYGGETWEDHRVSFAEWSEFKKNAPFEKLPYLEFDGIKLPESYAINRYLAKKYGLAGKDDLEQARVDAIADLHKDFFMDSREFSRVSSGKQAGDKEKVRQESFEPIVKRCYGVFNDILKKSPSGFFADSGLTWADFVVSQWYIRMKEIAPDLAERYPEIDKHLDRVHNVPQIKDYVAKRGSFPF
ncbi:hypothetical protein FO519_003035 [Halicephalobus sp. NKZ332]|nr:hypothetical protein FO519_003035 [Halicephalobus sp. NKZ332]